MNLFKLHLLVYLLVSFCLHAQDVETEFRSLKQSIKSDPLSCTGTLGMTANYYKMTGLPPRKDPLQHTVSANIQITLLNKISIPFTASLSNRNKTYYNGLERYNTAFNQFGLSPAYKALTVHLGYRSLFFSDYSLAGILLFGAGLEIKPKHALLSGTAAFGRIIKGSSISAPSQDNLFNYERWGSSLKLKFGNQHHNIELQLMHIKDLLYSLPFATEPRKLPAENTVIGFATQQDLKNKIKFELDYYVSIFTPDRSQKIEKNQNYSYRNQIHTDRTGTKTNYAFTGSIQYSAKIFQTGLKYKRISPDYQSLGSPYITNDVDERSLNFSIQAHEKKTNCTGALGIAQNNLDGSQQSINQRIIGALQLSYHIRSNWNISINYSSFTANSVPMRDLRTDSLRYVQFNTNKDLQSTYSTDYKNLKIQFNALFSSQESSNSKSVNQFINGQCGAHINFCNQGLQVSNNFLATKLILPLGDEVVGLGSSLQLQKTLNKNNFQVQVSTSALQQTTNKQEVSEVLTIGSGIQIKPRANVTFRIDYLLQKRYSKSNAIAPFEEHRMNFSCQILFNKKIQNEKAKS